MFESKYSKLLTGLLILGIIIIIGAITVVGINVIKNSTNKAQAENAVNDALNEINNNDNNKENNIRENVISNQGNVIVEPNCLSIQRVNDFLIGVKRYDKWAIVDFSGKQITQPVYSSLSDILKEGWRAEDFADKEKEAEDARLPKVE